MSTAAEARASTTASPRHHTGSTHALPSLSDPKAWMLDALCAQTDPEAYFPEKGGSMRQAKAMCRSCEVSAECLDYALANNERHGIWGGPSERERRQLKKGTTTTTTTSGPSLAPSLGGPHRPRGRVVLSDDDRAAIVTAYLDGVAEQTLAKAYRVGSSRIGQVLAAADVHRRTMSEARALRWANTHPAAAAS